MMCSMRRTSSMARDSCVIGRFSMLPQFGLFSSSKKHQSRMYCALCRCSFTCRNIRCTCLSICTEALQKPHRIGRRPWRRPIPRSLSLSYLRLLPCQRKKKKAAALKPLPMSMSIPLSPVSSPLLLIRSELFRYSSSTACLFFLASPLRSSSICFIPPFVPPLGQSLTPSRLTVAAAVEP
ncbi:uncharacterized protein TrAtP1_013368 [Trichoderma atroviride]|uniref:uncharacterized protein n=1 Tax=Hypocrea atroviridis TaxID=63577 RepID=UPI003327EC7E|nr:hypothetical protein TrAtP1_013368 [Trichoderma atroviride]